MNTRTRWWLLTVVAVLACTATVSLGFWQLSRAEQKNALGQSMAQHAGGAAVTNEVLNATQNAATLMHQPAELVGEWLSERTVFLDNRQMKDRVGFYVVTPLRLSNGAAVLVYRGWIARNFLDRTALPVLATPAGTVTVRGRIAPEPGKLYEPGTPSRTAIRQNLGIAQFSTETGLPLLPVVVMQSSADNDGLARDWPLINLGVDKHYGYAAQWFGIAALIAALYVWFQLLQPYLRRIKENASHVQ